MRSTSYRPSLLRLLLGAAALVFGGFLLSMTQASADEGSPLLGSVTGVVKSTGVVKTPDVVNATDVVKAAVKTTSATTKAVETTVAQSPVTPVLSAPVSRTAAVVSTTTAAVSEVVAATLEVADQAVGGPGVELPVDAGEPAVPGSAADPALPDPTTDAVTRARVAREAATRAFAAGPALQPTTSPPGTSAPSPRSQVAATVPDPVSPDVPFRGALGAVTLPVPTTTSGGGPRTIDATGLTSAASYPRSTALPMDGALQHPVTGPVPDPGSRPG